MRIKFVLIGFTGVGKSTTTQACVDFLKKRGYEVELYGTDQIIKQIFTRDNPTLKKFEIAKGITIPDVIFTSDDVFRDFHNAFGEEICRELEYRLIESVFEAHAHKKSTWFDLGGKTSTRDDTQKLLNSYKIIPIFLYAEHETVIKRLENDNQWKRRGAYRILGEKKWKEQAAINREKLLPRYIDFAKIIIAIDENNQIKSTAEIVKEIFYRLKELEVAYTQRKNRYLTSITGYFFKEENTLSLNANKRNFNCKL